jgi:hypothetical protein
LRMLASDLPLHPGGKAAQAGRSRAIFRSGCALHELAEFVDRLHYPYRPVVQVKAAAALAPPRPVPLAAGSGLGRPARRSGPGRLTSIRRSKRLIAAAIGRQAHASTFILPS